MKAIALRTSYLLVYLLRLNWTEAVVEKVTTPTWVLPKLKSKPMITCNINVSLLISREFRYFSILLRVRFRASLTLPAWKTWLNSCTRCYTQLHMVILWLVSYSYSSFLMNFTNLPNFAKRQQSPGSNLSVLYCLKLVLESYLFSEVERHVVNCILTSWQIQNKHNVQLSAATCWHKILPCTIVKLASFWTWFAAIYLNAAKAF